MFESGDRVETASSVEFLVGEWGIQSSLSPGAVSCSLFPTYMGRLSVRGPSARPGEGPSARRGSQLLRGGFILDPEGQG